MSSVLPVYCVVGRVVSRASTTLQGLHLLVMERGAGYRLAVSHIDQAPSDNLEARTRIVRAPLKQ